MADATAGGSFASLDGESVPGPRIPSPASRAGALRSLGGVAARRGDTRMSVREAPDAALVRAAQSGSAEAVSELFARHWPDAYRAAALVAGDRAAAEDIAQEAFLAAIRALPRFDRRRPLRPWLHRIVVNRAIDWSRARRLRHEVGIDQVAEAAAHERPADALSPDLAAALSSLSAEHRAVVVLRYLLGYTPGEIGDLLELPRGTVNSRMRRGLDALRDVLGDDGR